jgi:hypothetical protein
MKRTYILILVALFVLSLMSCVRVPDTMNKIQMAYTTKGMSSDSVLIIAIDSDALIDDLYQPVDKITFFNRGPNPIDLYLTDSQHISIAKHFKNKENDVLVGAKDLGVISGKQIYVHVFRSGHYRNIGVMDSPFIYAYTDNKLIYFGYPFEFAFHKDPLINIIGKKTLEYLNNTKEK